jgi:hypothetical protein
MSAKRESRAGDRYPSSDPDERTASAQRQWHLRADVVDTDGRCEFAAGHATLSPQDRDSVVDYLVSTTKVGDLL